MIIEKGVNLESFDKLLSLQILHIENNNIYKIIIRFNHKFINKITFSYP